MALPGRSAVASLRTCGQLLKRSAALLPLQQVRTAAAGVTIASKYKKRTDASSKKKKRKGSNAFKQYDLKDADQFALCDAMRYIRAFEVGRGPTSSKYEMHVKFRTLKNSPVLRNRLRLPHPVDTSLRVCVICPPDSKHAKVARDAGAALVGEDDVFDIIKQGKVNFQRCICHAESLSKLTQAGVARILGPKGLMPSVKTATVVKDVGAAVRTMIGGSEYRERLGVIRMAVGQLGFTPEQMQSNIRSFMAFLRKDCASMSHKVSKEIHEVVLSSTNSPGFSLNGTFRSQESVPTAALSTL